MDIICRFPIFHKASNYVDIFEVKTHNIIEIFLYGKPIVNSKHSKMITLPFSAYSIQWFISFNAYSIKYIIQFSSNLYYFKIFLSVCKYSYLSYD